MRSLVGGGLGGVQRRNLSAAHQMSNVVLVACCLTGVEVVELNRNETAHSDAREGK